MVKCTAIKKDGTQCTLNAKYGDKCGNHRDVSLEAVLDQLQELAQRQQDLMVRMDSITDMISKIDNTQQELITKIDRIVDNVNTLSTEITETLHRIVSHIPIINRFF